MWIFWIPVVFFTGLLVFAIVHAETLWAKMIFMRRDYEAKISGLEDELCSARGRALAWEAESRELTKQVRELTKQAEELTKENQRLRSLDFGPEDFDDPESGPTLRDLVKMSHNLSGHDETRDTTFYQEGSVDPGQVFHKGRTIKQHTLKKLTKARAIPVHRQGVPEEFRHNMREYGEALTEELRHQGFNVEMMEDLMNDAMNIVCRQPAWLYVGPVIIDTYPDIREFDEAYMQILSKARQRSRVPAGGASKSDPRQKW